MPLTRLQIFRRRRLALFGVIVAVLMVCIYLPFTLLAPLGIAHEEPTSAVVKTAAAATPVWPGFGASAFGAVGYDGLLETSGSTSPLPIASISKIVTALVVLEAKPLAVGEEGPTVTFSQANHDLYAFYLAQQGTVKPMPVGASMTQHQVLQVALIASANNYATTLATWAFGSVDAYAAATRTWLASHGLSHTTLVEPTGINPANASTASDLVALGKLALANPIVAAIVDTPTITLPIVGTIVDTNKLLGKEGVIGIKTGTLTDSTLLFASRFTLSGKSVTIVGAVLGAGRTTLYPAVSAILASVKAGFHSVVLAKKGEAFGTYTNRWTRPTRAVATEDANIVVWGDTPVTTSVALSDLRTGTRGAPTGMVKFVAGKTVVVVRLALDRTVSDPGALWRLTNPVAAFGSN